MDSFELGIEGSEGCVTCHGIDNILVGLFTPFARVELLNMPFGQGFLGNLFRLWVIGIQMLIIMRYFDFSSDIMLSVSSHMRDFIV